MRGRSICRRVVYDDEVPDLAEPLNELVAEVSVVQRDNDAYLVTSGPRTSLWDRVNDPGAQKSTNE